MAVTRPVIYTEVADAEVGFNRPANEEVIRKIIQNLNMLARLAQVGQIRMFATNQPGAATPDPTIWQLCDGTEIVEPTSPLRSTGGTQRYTPDLRNKFIRGAPNTSSNPTGGSATVNISHTHFANFAFIPQVIGANGSQQGCYTGVNLAVGHAHTVSADGSAALALNLLHFQTGLYMKIR